MSLSVSLRRLRGLLPDDAAGARDDTPAAPWWESLGWSDLRAYAKERGVSAAGSRAAIEARLAAAG